MNIPAVLLTALCIVLLVVAWCVLQVHNEDARKADRLAKRTEVDAGGESCTVVCRRVDISPAGDPVRYVTFAVQGTGRRELAIPDEAFDDDALTPGNRGELYCADGAFVRFVQTI